MLSAILRTMAFTFSAIVLLGFVLFAIDQLGDASQRTQDEIAGVHDPMPSAGEEAAREQRHGGARELINDVNDALLSPFTGVVDSGDIWVVRGLPTILALLVFGFGLGFLSRYMSGRA